MARSNYQFKKRQKEIARIKKREQKRQRKQNKVRLNSEENQERPQNIEESM